MTLKIREICGNSWLKFSHTKSFNQFVIKPRIAYFVLRKLRNMQHAIRLPKTD